VSEREQLREGTARRDADDVRCREPVGVEDADSVGDQIGARVSGAPCLTGGRSSRVPVVVADHEAPFRGQQAAEALLPPEHRWADAHDQENGRVGGATEGLRTELGAVRLDHALGHADASCHTTVRAVMFAAVGR
jgi:hypothetical protein